MTPETTQLPRLHPEENKRAHRAAFYATRLYPGPVGEMASKEIGAYAEFGYRLGDGALVRKAVDWLHEEWARREAERNKAEGWTA